MEKFLKITYGVIVGIISVIILLFIIQFLVYRYRPYEEVGPLLNVEHTIDEIIFETADGRWTKENLDEMRDFYYDKQRESVQAIVTVKFTAKEDFLYAKMVLTGGVDESEYEHQILYYEPYDYCKAGTYIMSDIFEFNFYDEYSAVGPFGYRETRPCKKEHFTVNTNFGTYK